VPHLTVCIKIQVLGSSVFSTGEDPEEDFQQGDNRDGDDAAETSPAGMQDTEQAVYDVHLEKRYRRQRMWMVCTAGGVTGGLISDANGGVWRGWQRDIRRGHGQAAAAVSACA